MIPSTIRNFIEIFSRLPGIGPRAATRLAFYLTELPTHTKEELARAFTNLDSVDLCPTCKLIKDGAQASCAICKNPTRNKNVIALIEKPTDLLTIEKSGHHKGTYMILGETPQRGMVSELQKKRLEELKARIQNLPEKKATELIVAVGPNTLGDLLYEHIAREFGDYTQAITRLGRGIPTGGEIEFTDPETLRDALQRRL
jgi:recombination protein RecR